MGDVEALRAKAYAILASNFSGVSVEDELIVRREGSVEGNVTIMAGNEVMPAYLILEFLLVVDVPDTPKLWEYVAFHRNKVLFGQLSLIRSSDGTVAVWLTHHLLGEYLDEQELVFVFDLMSVLADTMDDELVSYFGGRRTHQESDAH